MSPGPATPFEISPEMRAFAEKSVEQARDAFDKFMTAAQNTMSTFEGQTRTAQASAKDVSNQVIGFAEKNVASAFEYAQKLMQVRDPQALLQIHSDFVRSQMQVLSEQAKALGDTATRAAMDLRPKG